MAELIVVYDQLARLRDTPDVAPPDGAIRWTYAADTGAFGWEADLRDSAIAAVAADLAGHLADPAPHPGLSTTVPAGSLWGGDGTGVPTPIGLGDGFAIESGSLVYSGGGSGATAREVAAADLKRLVAWDDFGRPDGPLGTAPSGQGWITWGTSGWSIAGGVANPLSSDIERAVLQIGGGIGIGEVQVSGKIGTGSRPAGAVIAADDSNLIECVTSASTLIIRKTIGGVIATVATHATYPGNGADPPWYLGATERFVLRASAVIFPLSVVIACTVRFKAREYSLAAKLTDPADVDALQGVQYAGIRVEHTAAKIDTFCARQREI